MGIRLITPFSDHNAGKMRYASAPFQKLFNAIQTLKMDNSFIELCENIGEDPNYASNITFEVVFDEEIGKEILTCTIHEVTTPVIMLNMQFLSLSTPEMSYVISENIRNVWAHEFI